MRGRITLEGIRPPGYEYPVGLSSSSSNVVSKASFAPGANVVITQDGSSNPSGNIVYTFQSSTTFTSGYTGSVEYLIIAGGASGGSLGSSGGGGAGGLLYGIGYPIIEGASYTVTLGAGGSAGPGTGGPGSNGSNSVFGTLTALRGGAGAIEVDPNPGGASVGGGNDFGSGGGASLKYPGQANVNCVGGPGGAGTPGQGNPGGSSIHRCGVYGAGGGGGGAGAAGGNANGPGSNTQGAGNGGAGLTYSISGSPVTYAGGGGGSAPNNNPSGSPGTPACGCGGSGGGGRGADYGGGLAAVQGTANRGSGGGGGLGDYVGPKPSGAGGSGIVIIRHNWSPAYSIN